jgi:signal transduction histidine kinase
VRRRLTLLVAATTTLVLVAFLAPLALLVRSVAEDRAVNRAAEAAQSLVPLVATADRATVGQAAAASAYPVTVFFADGTQVGAPAARTPAVRLAATGRSLTAVTGQGREIVVAVQGLPGGTAVVRTAVPESALRRGVGRAWLLLTALGVLLVAVGLVVADRLARSVVRPIAALSAVSHRLAGGDLSARANPAGPPEVRDVAVALNHLAGRIRELLQQERETVADLSHRLRTPLTALRLEAEALPDPEQAQRVADRVHAVERTVTALIRHARRRAEPGAGRCDAAAVLRDRVAFWSVLAEDTGRAVTVAIPAGPAPVAVAEEELAAAVDAVLGNVFAHTPDGVGFAVRLDPRPDGGADVTVADEGPGLPAGVADPSGRGVSGGASTGLGLDIARRAAEASGGELRLGEGPGTRVVLSLGHPG